MIISLIAALTYSHVIGQGNCIPWKCSEDMNWFRLHTMDKPVIMGRKTFESIDGGKGLSGRINIVLSRFGKNCNVFDKQNDNRNSIVIWVNTPNEALSLVYLFNEVMIIGGGEIYKIFITLSTRIYLTYVNYKIKGDTFFPFFNKNCWFLIYKMFCRDRKFLIFERN